MRGANHILDIEHSRHVATGDTTAMNTNDTHLLPVGQRVTLTGTIREADHDDSPCAYCIDVDRGDHDVWVMTSFVTPIPDEPDQITARLDALEVKVGNVVAVFAAHLTCLDEQLAEIVQPSNPPATTPAEDGDEKWWMVHQAFMRAPNEDHTDFRAAVNKAIELGLARPVGWIDPAKLLVTDEVLENAWDDYCDCDQSSRRSLRAALEAAFAIARGEG